MNKFEIMDGMGGYSFNGGPKKDPPKGKQPEKARPPERKWHLGDRKDGFIFFINKIFFG
ncbi:MAG: hypothetical protein PHU71_00620 [Candidatus Gracilibacteria bacterium]|nr:hypothetical protein [Candidatus Gracilibacteria bacterium]